MEAIATRDRSNDDYWYAPEKDCITRWIEEMSGCENCCNCKHFCQLYQFSKSRGYIPSTHGLCGYPRIKPRRIYDTCDKFERK